MEARLAAERDRMDKERREREAVDRREKEERERREKEEKDKREKEEAERREKAEKEKRRSASADACGERADDFIVRGKLGAGAFGLVFKVERIADGKDFALKQVAVPRGTSIMEMLNEILVMKLLKHRNILKIEDAWCGDKELYLLLELCPDGSLNDLFEDAYEAATTLAPGRTFNNPFLLPGNLESLTFDLVEALALCESKGIVHADIKPENILMATETTVSGDVLEIPKLADFGLAQIASTAKGYVSKAGGTLGYAAPEVMRGEKVDSRADVYSLGVALWQLVMVRRPFERQTEVQINKFLEKQQLMLNEADLPANPLFRDLINSMLVTDKINRPKASAVLAELKKRGVSRPSVSSTKSVRSSIRAFATGAAGKMKTAPSKSFF
jgi:serine/threonine protein kinase